jgi:hypothetical protein
MIIPVLNKIVDCPTILPFASILLFLYSVAIYNTTTRAWSRIASQIRCSIFIGNQFSFTKQIAFLSSQQYQVIEPLMRDQIVVALSNLRGSFDPIKHCCHVRPGQALLTLGMRRIVYITKSANSQATLVFGHE